MASRVNSKSSEHPEPAKSPPKVPFAKQLQKPLPQRASRPAPKLLERNQKASAAFAATLQSRRAEAEEVRPEHRRVAQTLARLLIAEHEPERDPGNPSPPSLPRALEPTMSPPSGGATTSTASTPPLPAPVAALAAKLEALIARAEQLSLSEGPALKLGLDAGEASAIEVVRTGKGEVAVTLTARSAGEHRALREKLGAIRAALGERGLAVKRITLAR